LQQGHHCTWIQSGIGASVAASGALDWDLEPAESHGVLSPELQRFGEQVLHWHLPPEGVQVVTNDGQLRWARGAVAGVLDFSGLGPGTIAVLDPGRPGWDTERLCAALGQEPLFEQAGLRAVSLRVPLLTAATRAPSAPLADAQFARALPPSAQLAELIASATAQLAAQLGEPPKALLCGPWMYTEVAAVAALEAEPALVRLGIRIGETLSPPYGLAGQRFEASRKVFVDGHPALRCLVARAVSVTRKSGGWLARVEPAFWTGPESGAGEVVEAERCVLALGGIAGGGIQLGEQHHVRLGVSLEPASHLRWQARPWLLSASETGLDVQGFGLHNLTRVGLEASMHSGSLRAVGDLIADRPRSILRAAQSGLEAFA
jgi:hypothetical protein